MYTPKLLIHSNVIIERERSLPIKGKFHVALGDSINGDALILSTELRGDLTIVRPNDRFSIPPDEALKTCLVGVGERVHIGSVLCQTKGLFGYFQESIESPVDGCVEFISEESSHIGLRSDPESLEVKAHIPGEVISLQNERLVVLRSEVGVLQGVFGRGLEYSGVLHFLPLSRSEVVEQSHLESIKENLSGAIIAGGMTFSKEAFDYAVDSNVKAIVTGSFRSNFVSESLGGLDAPSDSDMPVVLITEGFGELALSENAYAFLSWANGRMASISGRTQVRAGAIRPELIIHEADHSEVQIKEEMTMEPSIGSMVRVVRGDDFGMVGTVSEIPDELHTLESGVKARTLKVRLKNGSESYVALANLEAL